MADRIVVSWGAGQSLFALMRQDRVIELIPYRDGATLCGGVYLGRVTRIVPALGGAFIDIGAAETGFLRKAGSLREGEAVIVQVEADAYDDKGPRLVRKIALKGAAFVYLPDQSGIQASRRLADARKAEIRHALSSHLQAGEGGILRAYAAQCPIEAIIDEIARLRRLWQQTCARAQEAKAPCCLIAADPLGGLLLDYPDISEIVVDDRALHVSLTLSYPQARFDAQACEIYGLSEAMEEAMAEDLPLPTGGRIWFQKVRALTAIDVDSGTGRPDQVNRHAVEMIARQVRLRGLAGQMAADFVTEKNKAALGRLSADLKNALADDRRPTHVFGPTAMGLVEFSRQRAGLSFAEAMIGPYGMIFSLSRRIVRENMANPQPFAVEVSASVADIMRAMPKEVAEIEARLGWRLDIRSRADLKEEELYFVRKS